MSTLKPRCPRSLGLTLLLAGAPLVHATTYTVGNGAGCTHTDLRTAMQDANQNLPGPHVIKVAKAVDTSLSRSWPSPAQEFMPYLQTDMTVEGGYASCSSTAPSGYTELTYAQPGDDGASLLHLTNNGSDPRRTLTFKRLYLNGGTTPTGTTLPRGAIFMEENITLILDDGSRISHFETLGCGGGVKLHGDVQFLPIEQTRPVLRITGGSEISYNQADNGGGVCARKAKVILDGGEISHNTATRHGGGIYISDTTEAPGDPDVYDLVFRDPQSVGVSNIIRYNTAVAPNPPSENYDGRGGGIYAENTDIYFYFTYIGQPHLIQSNEADKGGGMYVRGEDGPSRTPYAVVRIRDTRFAYNRANDRGGAIYSIDAVDWRFYSSDTSPNPWDTSKNGPDTLFHANEAHSARIGNEAGGAAYITNTRSDGMSRGIMRFYRSWFVDNHVSGATDAAIGAYAASKLEIYRSIFDGNYCVASFDPIQAVIRLNNGKGLRATYSTFVNNEADYLFVGNVSSAKVVTYNLQGSILWNPDVDGAVHNIGSGTIEKLTYGCMVSKHLLFDVNGYTHWSVAPDLDDHYRPGGLSPAIDHCAEVPGIAPEYDIHFVGSPYDVPGVQARFANPGTENWDLGAVEQTDVVFANAFGYRPQN